MNIIVAQEEASERLDKLLASRFPDHSRTYFQYLIDEGAVLLNGKIVKKRIQPKEGDEIEICFLLTPELSVKPEAIPLHIIYEDDHLIAVDKPAGMVVHPAPGSPNGTFVNALLYHCHHLPEGSDHLRPGIVHRLDKDTTGVLVAAKTREAHRGLIELFSSRAVEKKYLALCLGKIEDGEILAPIGRCSKDRKKMDVVEKGREAKTLIHLLDFQNNISLVEATLITGRTHQIRVHLKHNKTPILGDPLYGAHQMNQKYHLSRQMLHAYEVRFKHPITGKTLELHAHIPKDFHTLMEKLKLSLPR